MLTTTASLSLVRCCLRSMSMDEEQRQAWSLLTLSFFLQTGDTLGFKLSDTVETRTLPWQTFISCCCCYYYYYFRSCLINFFSGDYKRLDQVTCRAPKKNLCGLLFVALYFFRHRWYTSMIQNMKPSYRWQTARRNLCNMQQRLTPENMPLYVLPRRIWPP